MSELQVRALVQWLVGKPIWFVNAGGAAGAAFSLSLGEKRARELPLKNPSVSEEFRKFQGEATLYIWCTWRLESGHTVASSDQEIERFLPILKELVGETVTTAEVAGNCFDLTITAGQSQLQVFCDHVPPDSSFDGNWELVLPSASVVVGPGYKYELAGS